MVVHITPANVLLATRRIGSVAKCFVLPDRSYDTFLMQMINAIDQADVCVLLNRLLPIAFDPNIYADIPPSDQPLAAAIQAQTALMLEQVLTDVLRTAHAHIALELDAFPLLKKYCDDTELQNLIGLMLEGSDSGRKFHLRLLAAFSVASGEMKSAEVLARILFATRGEAQLAAFQAFAIAIVPLFPELTNLMVKILPRLRNVLTDSTDDTWLFNLLTLIRWEREQSADDQHGGIIRLSQALLADFGAAVTDFISFATAFDRVSTVKCCLAIIESLETPTHLLPRFAFKIAHQMVDVIFFALAQADSGDGIALLKMAYNCAFIFVESQVYLCRQEFLATLIERAFADCDAVFGTGRPGGDKDSSKSQDSDTSLLEQNYKLVSKRNAAAMVHSGVIGRGAKRNEQVVVKEDALLKRLLFVDVVDKFCQQRASGEGEMIMYNLHTCRQLAVLLTDHLCVDSISAYHAWEDWDLERDAVPRYIEVSKRVNDIPFAWDLLFLVAEAYPGLWFCLPVVKAMLASLMSQLESSVEKTKAVDAKILVQLDRWFLLVTKGMMLPVQLSQIYEVASKVSVHEAFILLLDIWRYFQSMSPESHVLAAHFDQLQVKVAHRVDPLMGDVERFTENCRLVIQRNIAAVGYLFPKLFPDLLSQPS
uniref:Integrator complex subunit 5 C-terminal domain-containing protein n=1 Tax=Plectus sambesii TaxID=2011161 RepID=A0A914WCR1_9BILA